MWVRVPPFLPILRSTVKHYAVYFFGYWPVGAVAYVKARGPKEAAEKVYNVLPGKLKESNSPNTMDVKELKDDVVILLDGKY